MSFFNKYKPFPAFFDVINHFDLISQSELIQADEMAKAYGIAFTRYANSQPETIKCPFLKIAGSGATKAAITKKDFVANTKDFKFPVEFHRVYDIHEERAAVQALSTAAIQRVAAAQLNSEKATANVSRLMNSGKADAITKAEKAADSAKSVLGVEIEKSEDYKKKLFEIDLHYAERLVSAITTPALVFIENKLRIAREVAPIAEEIDAAADEIKDYEDPNIVNIRNYANQFKAPEAQ